jgi:hypothetical protein
MRLPPIVVSGPSLFRMEAFMQQRSRPFSHRIPTLARTLAGIAAVFASLANSPQAVGQG